jgi:hypothetical protein
VRLWPTRLAIPERAGFAAVMIVVAVLLILAVVLL